MGDIKMEFKKHRITKNLELFLGAWYFRKILPMIEKIIQFLIFLIFDVYLNNFFFFRDLFVKILENQKTRKK